MVAGDIQAKPVPRDNPQGGGMLGRFHKGVLSVNAGFMMEMVGLGWINRSNCLASQRSFYED
jgi:hypothetical protein